MESRLVRHLESKNEATPSRNNTLKANNSTKPKTEHEQTPLRVHQINLGTLTPLRHDADFDGGKEPLSAQPRVTNERRMDFDDRSNLSPSAAAVEQRTSADLFTLIEDHKTKIETAGASQYYKQLAEKYRLKFLNLQTTHIATQEILKHERSITGKS